MSELSSAVRFDSGGIGPFNAKMNAKGFACKLYLLVITRLTMREIIHVSLIPQRSAPGVWALDSQVVSLHYLLQTA